MDGSGANNPASPTLSSPIPKVNITAPNTGDTAITNKPAITKTAPTITLKISPILPPDPKGAGEIYISPSLKCINISSSVVRGLSSTCIINPTFFS